MKKSPLVTQIDVPDRAVDVLIRQGGYHGLIKKYFWMNRLFPRWPLSSKKVHANKQFLDRLLQHRIESVNHHADLILKYAPQSLRSILDIGCGLGLVDLVLYKRIHPAPDVYLLDKDNEHGSFSSVSGGFHQRYVFTADLGVTRAIFLENGAQEEHVHFVEPDANAVGALQNIDLILSLTSWGFHYPIETYWEGVEKIMHEESVLFIDLRKSQNGFEFLKNKFDYHHIAKETDSFIRAAFSHSSFETES